MQFAYQFPELVERLVLVASGGFGREVAPALRAATLPGTALALGTATRLTPQWAGKLLHRTARAVPGVSRPEVDEVAQSITALADPGARDAFVHTVRSALDLGGQRLNGLERLRLVSDAPLLLIAGRKDLCIPTEHHPRARRLPRKPPRTVPVRRALPPPRPPLRFAQVVLDFLATTTASHTDLQDVRRRLRGTSDTATTTAA